jgi:hypothetical protein
MRTAIVLLCLALAGCGDDGDAQGGAAGGGETARLSGAITFELTGGDGFRDDEMTVEADGSARVETRSGERTAELKPDELSALAQAVEDANLPAVESAVTRPPQPDMVSYRFTYRGSEVETDSVAQPEQLDPLLRTFVGLVDSYAP